MKFVEGLSKKVLSSFAGKVADEVVPIYYTKIIVPLNIQFKIPTQQLLQGLPEP